MAINFAAANMAGYNNPEVKVIPILAEAKGGLTLINPPSYADISNICRSGAYPVLHIHITNANLTMAYIIPLSHYKYDGSKGMFSFCTILHDGDFKEGGRPMALAVIFREGEAAPVIKPYEIPATPI